MQEVGNVFCEPFSKVNGQTIERLSFSSGSAKGAGYLGCLLALIDTDILPHVKKVSGSSAGAIMAAFVSIGSDFSELKNESMNMQCEILKTDFSKLLGERVGELFNNKLGLCAITRDGKPLEDKIRQFINSTILNFWDTEAGQTLCVKSKHIKKIHNRFINELDPKFTFQDLHYLHKALPRRFKDLTILTVELPSGSECVLDYKSAPDFEIALACRASSAIPAVFAPVVARVNGISRILIDGGIFSFLPEGYFDNKNGKFTNKKEKQTLLFAFADDPILEKSSAYKAIYTDKKPIYTPHWLEQVVRDYAPWALGSFEGPYTNSERWNLVYEHIRNRYADNLVILGVGEVRHFEFQKATKLGRVMSVICYLDTLFYAIERLSDTNAKVDKFFVTFVPNFLYIYLALIKTAGINPQDDHFYNELRNYLSDQKIDVSSLTQEKARKFCRHIRERVRNRFDSYECFALSRACEFGKNLLTKEELSLEIYKQSLLPLEEPNSLDLSLFCSCSSEKNEEEEDSSYIFSWKKNILKDLEALQT